MIKARHNRIYFWFFGTFYDLMNKIHFRKRTIVSRPLIPDHHSVLLLQNHFSWWDGYWSYDLSRRVFKRKFHVMMDENNLKKRMFLNRIGVFSVQKNSRNMIESLNYSASILNNPKHLLTIYPSGALFSQHKQEIDFQNGVDRILQKSGNNCSVVFAVFLLDYFGFARPEIRIYLQDYQGEIDSEVMSKAYHAFYKQCVNNQTE